MNQFKVQIGKTSIAAHLLSVAEELFTHDTPFALSFRQTVRWKPPPPRNSTNDPHIGWRTEFRSMEMQLTDFENAAFSVFTVLLQRVILTFDLNLYIPISRVDANMQRAHSRNAAAKGKFFFRRHLAPLEEGEDGYGVRYISMFSKAVNGAVNGDSEGIVRQVSVDENGVSSQRRRAPFAHGSDEENSYEEMTMAEIMCARRVLPGLLPLVRAYLDHINADAITMSRLSQYLDFIEKACYWRAYYACYLDEKLCS